MSIMQRYFQAFHHLSQYIPNAQPYIDLNNQSLEALSILLCVNRERLPIFLHCQSFKNIFPPSLQNLLCQGVFFDYLLDIQAHILIHNPITFDELLPYFAKLNLASVINDEELALFSTLKNESPHSVPEVSQKNAPKKEIKDTREALFEIHKQLYSLLPIQTQNMLSNISKKLEDGRLCIGVTGVFNAGKSTFLNALLSQQILGTSNIPETANLTILRYGEHKSAKVHFWDKEQWADLCAQSAYDENLRAFIEECQVHFGDKLKDFITEPYTIKDIEIDKLNTYTSANHPSKLCNLIQKVELLTPLNFLQNGVEIVDTPGLDDPITKREDITREFLRHFDILIHVMNASCAATQKDIDFILESLLEQNISRLLIVLTRIDLLTQKDIQASLEYTKSSLVAQLKNAHYKGDIATLINRIDFIPLAGYAALLHRTQGNTKELNITLEQSGILEIESYLQKMLLGKDSLKARDVLYIAYRATYKIIKETLDSLQLQTTLLQANDEELENLILQEKAHNQALLGELEKLQSHLNKLYDELKSFLETLQSLSANTLSKATISVKDKVFDDIIYDYKNNNKIKPSNLYKMIELSLKDCFADIARGYRYKLSEKITLLKSEIASTEEIKPPIIHFELKNSEVMSLMQPLSKTIPLLLQSRSKDEALKEALDTTFEHLFNAFSKLIEVKNKEISHIFLKHFDEITKLQKEHIHTQIEQKERNLQAAIAQHNQSNRQELKQSIQSQYTQIKTLMDRVESHLQDLQQ